MLFTVYTACHLPLSPGIWVCSSDYDLGRAYNLSSKLGFPVFFLVCSHLTEILKHCSFVLSVWSRERTQSGMAEQMAASYLHLLPFGSCAHLHILFFICSPSSPHSWLPSSLSWSSALAVSNKTAHFLDPGDQTESTNRRGDQLRRRDLRVAKKSAAAGLRRAKQSESCTDASAPPTRIP